MVYLKYSITKCILEYRENCTCCLSGCVSGSKWCMSIVEVITWWSHDLTCMHCYHRQESERKFMTFHDGKPLEPLVNERWEDFNVRVNTTLAAVLGKVWWRLMTCHIIYYVIIRISLCVCVCAYACVFACACVCCVGLGNIFFAI